MFCPSCGKEIPNGSKFCLYCGSSVASPGTDRPPAAVVWEYKDFVYTFASGSLAHLTSETYTDAGAKLEFWQSFQVEIKRKLQDLIDEGWEPISEVGSGGITLHKYISSKPSNLFIPMPYVEPTEFRLKMRRKKSLVSKTVSEPSRSETLRLHVYHRSYTHWNPMMVTAMNKLKFAVFVDGENLGKIQAGKSDTFEIPSGSRLIQIGSTHKNAPNLTMSDDQRGDDDVYMEFWFERNGILSRFTEGFVK